MIYSFTHIINLFLHNAGTRAEDFEFHCLVSKLSMEEEK